MSTVCRIGIQFPSGTVQSVYVHSDGYPERAGAILLQHYTSWRAAMQIINLGDLALLEALPAPPPGKAHTFSYPEPGVTIAYGRDRQEKDTGAVFDQTINGFLQTCQECDARWAYLLDEYDEWHAIDLRVPGIVLLDMQEAIATDVMQRTIARADLAAKARVKMGQSYQRKV